MRRIYELLDKPLEYSPLNQKSSEVVVAGFETEEHWYEVAFIVDSDSLAIFGKTQRPGNAYYEAVQLGISELWSLEFSQTDESAWGAPYSITGAGDAPLVFSTVVAVAKDFLDQWKPQAIIFTAKEESRQKLYRLFTSRISKLSPLYVGLSEALYVGQDTAYLIVQKDLV